MKVAVIGGTGFVGSYLVDELLAQNHQPTLLVRPGSESKVAQAEHCVMVNGDVKDAESIRRTLQDCAAAIYNIGILRESKSKGITFEALQYQGAVRTIDIAVELGVKRFLLMSANGVKPQGTPYQTSKYRAEQYLQQTTLDWTIFRPSLLFGDPRGTMEFCTQLKNQMIEPPIPAPLFYEGLFPTDAGSFEMSPIHVKDVATAFVKALTMPAAHGQIYGLCGPDAFTWKRIIQTIAAACGKTKLALPAPVFFVKTVAALFEGMESFPITRDQLTMLLEGNTCDASEVFKLLGITPIRFEQQSLAYLRR